MNGHPQSSPHFPSPPLSHSEGAQRPRQHGLQLTGRAHINRRSVRYAIYYLLILGIYVMHAQQQTFIYFQF